MPAVRPGSKVLVTGASGFIASWVVRTLLDEGFKVKGTARSTAKGDYLVKLFDSPAFDYVVVEDVVASDAFRDAAQDVDGIIHTASPAHPNFQNPEEAIKPAVDGTVNLLKSAGPNIERIVITSSVAALTTVPRSGPSVFSGADWDQMAIKEVEEKGKDASPVMVYYASKVLAEKAAWQFLESSDTKYDIATVLPSLTFGPMLHEVSSPDRLNASCAAFYHALYRNEGLTKDTATDMLFNWVDVREVALTHVRALSVPEAGGKRFICAAEPFTFQQFLDVAAKSQPPIEVRNKGWPGASDDTVPLIRYDTRLTMDLLGARFRSKEETMRDVFKDYRKRGW